MAEDFDPIHLWAKSKNCDKIRAVISHIWCFLKDYIPLANTHGAEFLSHKQWTTFIPPAVQLQLLSLSDDELVNLPLCRASLNEVDKSEGNDSMKNVMGTEELDRSDTMACGKSSFKGNIEMPSNTSCGLSSHHELNAVITKALTCHLENLGVLAPCKEAIGYDCNSRCIISEAMSEKKSHEVQLMSSAVTSMVKTTGADLVVDVGSGKGYLSMELADHQRISVLGLDSSATNTHGAKVRKEKLTPRWSGLVTKEEKKAENKQELQRSCGTDMQEIDNHISKTHNESLHMRGGMTTADSKTTDDLSLYVPLTLYVHPQMNLRKTLAEQAVHLCGVEGKLSEAKLVLTGLHTCGSLAVNAMRLFTKDAGTVGLCCVGCCYQLMEEGSQDLLPPFLSECPSEHEWDFPLSQFGQSLGLYLGRNARNLASQSVHRVQTSKQLQGKDFYWRALLDVLLHDLSLPVPERIIGMRKLNKQCKTFYEYAVKAFGKLGFAPDLVTPELVQILEEKYQAEQTKMAAFFQYKLLLAPVVESLILLDRLLFLAEQDCVGQAYLVKLFDPVTSPRCYAVVAYKADSLKST